MDAKDIIDALKKGADFVEAITPVATAIGGETVGKVLAVISTVSDIAENLEARAKEGTAVFTYGDSEQAEVKAVIARLAAVNDDLAAKIAAS